MGEAMIFFEDHYFRSEEHSSLDMIVLVVAYTVMGQLQKKTKMKEMKKKVMMRTWLKVMRTKLTWIWPGNC